MISKRETLVDPAKSAGIAVPPDLHHYDRLEYPHWHLYCLVQIDRPTPNPDSPNKNAHAVASIEQERIIGVNFADIANLLE